MARIKTRVRSAEVACTVIFGWPDEEYYTAKIREAIRGFEVGLAVAFDGFTRINADGSWKGKRETSVLYYFTASDGIEAERVVDALLEQYGDDLATQWVHFDKKGVSVHHREIEQASAATSPNVEPLRQHYAGRWPQQDALTRDEQLRKAHTTQYWEYAIDGGLAGYDYSLVHIWRTVQAHLEDKGHVEVAVNRMHSTPAATVGPCSGAS